MVLYLSLNIDRQKFIEDYTNHKWIEEKKEYALKTPCPFLNKDEDNGHNCQIYPFRPFVCRFFLLLNHKEIESMNNSNEQLKLSIKDSQRKTSR